MNEQRWEKWELVEGARIPMRAQGRIKTCFTESAFVDWYDADERAGDVIHTVSTRMVEDWEFRVPAEPPKIIPHIPWLQSVVATFDEADRIEFQRRLVDLGNWVVVTKQANEQCKEVTV